MVDLDSKLFQGLFVDADGIKSHVFLAVAGVKENQEGNGQFTEYFRESGEFDRVHVFLPRNVDQTNEASAKIAVVVEKTRI